MREGEDGTDATNARGPSDPSSPPNPRSTTSTTSTTDKIALRREIRRSRRSPAPGHDREAEGAASARALLTSLAEVFGPLSREGEHPAYGVGEPCVAIYRAAPTEPSTAALARALHERGVPVIVPDLLADLDLDWRELRPDGTQGPLLGREAIAAAHVIVTPALAVDHHGTRLGQGGGSYDRALARRRPGALVVAVVGDGEYVEGPLPREPHDEPVAAVVTPALGLLRIRDSAR